MEGQTKRGLTKCHKGVTRGSGRLWLVVIFLTVMALRSLKCSLDSLHFSHCDGPAPVEGFMASGHISHCDGLAPVECSMARPQISHCDGPAPVECFMASAHISHCDAPVSVKCSMANRGFLCRSSSGRLLGLTH